MARLTILPSPLLPPRAYVDLADAFDRQGVEATVAEVPLDIRTPHDVLRRWAQTVDPESVLIPHSNAGLLAPALHSRGTVFLDAALLPPSGTAHLAPAFLLDHLTGLADADGLLPPWTRWWPREDLAEVVPEDRFDALDAACPRLPLSYFHATVTAPDRWADGACAYLALGDAYAEEQTFAQSSGWPVRRLDGGHLHFLTEPDRVAAAVLALSSAAR